MNIGNLDSNTVIDNFWEDDPKNLASVHPMCLVMNIKPEKVLGLSTFNGAYTLRTYEVEKKKTRAFHFMDYQKELGLPSADFKVVTIDKSQRTNLFFAAFSYPKLAPFLLQVKIAKEGLSAVCSYVLDIEGFNQINRTSVHPISKTDYVLVAGTNALVLLKSKDKGMSLVHKFENLLAGEVADACIIRNKFFAVSPDIPFILETCASNKVDAKDIQKQLIVEEKKEEIKFDRYDITKLDLGNGKFHKIDVSKKGDVIYAIGKGITAITDLNTAKPQKIEVFYSDKAFSCIKTMKNGNFLVQEAKSNDICELSPTLKELKRLKGVPGVMLQNDAIKGSRHSYDDNYLPWVKGSNLISLITVKDLSMKEIKNFFGQDTETDIIPIMSISNAEGDKLFGTSICKGQMRLSYWEKSANPKYFNLNDLYPNVGIILSADINQDGSILFIGGSTSFDFARGRAIIQAVNLNKKLSYVTDIILEEKENLFVSRVRRFEDTNRFLALTSKSIYIYEFRNQLFHFMSVIQNILPGTEALADVVIQKCTLFVLSAESKFIQKIEFASN